MEEKLHREFDGSACFATLWIRVDPIPALHAKSVCAMRILHDIYIHLSIKIYRLRTLNKDRKHSRAGIIWDNFLHVDLVNRTQSTRRKISMRYN